MNDQERDDLIERVANALDVPEPSPLFWEHFPERVRAAVSAVPAEAPAWWRRRPAMLAMALTVAIAAAGWVFFAPQPPTPDAVAPDVAMMTPEAEDDLLEDDPDWAVMSSLAASAGVEMLREAGFGVAPGGAEAAIDDLDEAERAELVAMLRAEMKGDDAGGT
jgi:hypothetical protein